MSQFILFGGSIISISPTASRCTPARPPQRRRRPRAPGVPEQVRECCAARPQNAPRMLAVCPTNFSCRDFNFGCACGVCPEVSWLPKHPQACELFVSLFLTMTIAITRRTSGGLSTNHMAERIPVSAALKAGNLPPVCVLLDAFTWCCTCSLMLFAGNPATPPPQPAVVVDVVVAAAVVSAAVIASKCCYLLPAACCLAVVVAAVVVVVVVVVALYLCYVTCRKSCDPSTPTCCCCRRRCCWRILQPNNH